ncbi:MAG: hypothetical protein MZV63_12050 [Marinilabiliales bacterium]|nr:hypothetical protein [Marinilabiliales bacterium]
MVEAKGLPFKVDPFDQTSEKRSTDASYVTTQLRAGQHGGAPPRRISRPAPRVDRSGDDRRGRHGKGAPHDPCHHEDRHRISAKLLARHHAGQFH